ncbi:glycosyltransferase, partial [Megasphaera cerevisiae]|uniref:glycosyltransferase n=1 Tax=Megasphaera cerevisiae TaxID=39029 RepID=UPI000960A9FA
AINYKYIDYYLEQKNIFKVSYCGSVRLVNNLKLLCDAGKIIKNRGIKKLFIMIHGSGDQVDKLQKYCIENDIDNVKLYGWIEKVKIPYVLTHSDLCILCYQNTPLLRFGGSMNKMFEYFASGKPVVTNAHMAYSFIEKYNCGSELNTNSAEKLADEIIRFYKMSNRERETFGQRSRQAAEDYDIQLLCERLDKVMEYAENRRR